METYLVIWWPSVIPSCWPFPQEKMTNGGLGVVRKAGDSFLRLGVGGVGQGVLIWWRRLWLTILFQRGVLVWRAGGWGYIFAEMTLALSSLLSRRVRSNHRSVVTLVTGVSLTRDHDLSEMRRKCIVLSFFVCHVSISNTWADLYKSCAPCAPDDEGVCKQIKNLGKVDCSLWDSRNHQELNMSGSRCCQWIVSVVLL